MRRLAVALVVTFALGVALGLTAARVLNAQQLPLKRTDLLKADIVGMEGKELIVQLVEFAPGGASGKHYHPGHEANYILEGSTISEKEGQPPKTRQAGDVDYTPAKLVHEGKNASATAPAKLVVFRIHEKGQPVSVNITEPHFQK